MSQLEEDSVNFLLLLEEHIFHFVAQLDQLIGLDIERSACIGAIQHGSPNPAAIVGLKGKDGATVAHHEFIIFQCVAKMRG